MVGDVGDGCDVGGVHIVVVGGAVVVVFCVSLFVGVIVPSSVFSSSSSVSIIIRLRLLFLLIGLSVIGIVRVGVFGCGWGGRCSINVGV